MKISHPRVTPEINQNIMKQASRAGSPATPQEQGEGERRMLNQENRLLLMSTDATSDIMNKALLPVEVGDMCLNTKH